MKTDPDMLVVGLTGSIGSGKSVVADMLAKLGAEVIDADQLAREVVAPGSAGLSEIRGIFGDSFITKEGQLDRKALGKLVFSDAKKRALLEDITHPLIRKLFLERLKELKRAPAAQPKIIVYVVPLLFESRYNYQELDAIIVVTAPAQVCLERVMARDHCTRQVAESKLASQLPSEEKTARADFVVENDSDLAELRKRVEILWRELVSRR